MSLNSAKVVFAAATDVLSFPFRQDFAHMLETRNEDALMLMTTGIAVGVKNLFSIAVGAGVYTLHQNATIALASYTAANSALSILCETLHPCPCDTLEILPKAKALSERKPA